MECENGKIYLDISEQKTTQFKSPVDIASFPLHRVREAIDERRDYLEAMAGADDDDLTHAERAALPKQLEEVRKKSSIVRDMCKLAAMDSLVNGDPGSKS